MEYKSRITGTGVWPAIGLQINRRRDGRDRKEENLGTEEIEESESNLQILKQARLTRFFIPRHL